MGVTDRPQDIGRRHRRGGAVDDETLTLLGQWHDVLRAELATVIAELQPQPDASQPGLDGKPLPPKRPALAARRDLVALGVTVARELGAAVNPTPGGGEQARPPRPPSRRKVSYG